MKKSKVVKTTSMAASIIGYSEDLLPKILIHLPAKTLVIFKLVSKQWKFLISDPQFAVNHFRNNSDLSTPSGIFLYHPSHHTNILSVPFLRNPAGSVPPLSPFLDQLLPTGFPRSSRRVLQSCNGLLLCVFFRGRCTYKVMNAKSVCVICNPTTRDFRVLPTPDLGTTYEWLVGLTLVFNPSESHHYKVVCIKRSGEIRMLSENSGGDLYIYSSETNHWKLHRSAFINPPHLQFRRGVFSNGMVFWIGWNHTYYYNVKSNENVGVLEVPVFPTFLRYVRTTRYFGESCGRVFYAEAAAARGFPPRYHIFELDSVAMKWSNGPLNYSSQHFGDYTLCPRTSLRAVSKSSREEEEDDNWDYVFSLTDQLIIVNSVMGKRVQNCDKIRDFYKYNSSEYVPSLVPV